MKLSEIISILLLEITVEEDFEITGINNPILATSSEITFLSDRRFEDSLKTTKACVALVKESDKELVPLDAIAIIVKDPYLSMAILSGYFAKEVGKKNSDGVVIGDGCYIADGVTIGEGSVIYPNVTLLHGVNIGKNCIIQSGTVVGSEGFGYAHDSSGKHIKIHHFGGVVIGDDVEIGANCAIDRAVFGVTTIKDGTKIDNLVHIGHNCEIGQNSIITGQCGLAGSSKLGRSVMLGAQSGVAGHIAVGDGAIVAARGGVTKSIKGGETYAGFPIKKHKQWLKTEAIISKLSKEKR